MNSLDENAWKEKSLRVGLQVIYLQTQVICSVSEDGIMHEESFIRPSRLHGPQQCSEYEDLFGFGFHCCNYDANKVVKIKKIIE